MQRPNKIYNFWPSDHFLSQMSLRAFPEELVALCLAIGEPIKGEKKLEFCLSSRQIKEAISMGYLDPWLLQNVMRCIVVVKRGILITCYKKFGEI